MTTPYVDPQTIHNPATGTSPPASWGDTVRDGLEFLARPPGCQVNRTTDFNLGTSGSWYAIPFNAADTRDTDNFHSTTTNNDTVTIPTGLGGWYFVTLYTEFQASSTGLRGVRFVVNGTVTVGAIYTPGINTFDTRFTTTDEIKLNAGDAVKFEVYQNSTVGLLLKAARATLRLVAVS